MRMFLIFSLSILSTFCFADESDLIGGRPAVKGEYPEILYISSGNSRCSATVVGEQVILTAAHCVKDHGQIGPVDKKPELIEFVLEQVVYRAKCFQAPLYRDKIEDHDLALCKVDKKLTIKPAKVDKQGPKIGHSVVLTGYGCISEGGTGGNDGILRIGKAKVIKLPEGKNHWFYTEAATALCFGDSGGPSMLSSKLHGKHKVIGVNSRGDIKTLSLMTALFTEESIKFMEDFIAEHKVDICGISKGCE